MKDDDYEQYQIRRIPENFGNGVDIAGLHFQTRFLIEGVLLAVITLVVSFTTLKFIGLTDIKQLIGICLVFVFLALLLGIKGINDEPLTKFIANAITYRKKRRTAYYNPRIKFEAKSIVNEDKDALDKNAIPREKILAIFNKYKEAYDKKQQERAKAFEERNAFDENNMFFEDDIGIIKKPNSYLSKEEVAEYKKKKNKMSGWKKARKEEDDE